MKTFIYILLILGLTSEASVAIASSERLTKLSGSVIDSAGRPIIGASVTLSKDGQPVSGSATDEVGAFSLRIGDTTRGLTLTCTAVGFRVWSCQLDSLLSIDELVISLSPESIDIGGFTVRPLRDEERDDKVYGSEEVNNPSKTSLVSNNPIDAVREPQISRQGSSYSSKLRINGTIPTYYLNGIPIGSDPNHYGMFSIIPAPAVGRIAFHGSGTSAEFEVPATLELSSPAPFGHHFGGEAEFSFVQATTSASWGTDRFFTSGTVRKSVLDKLVRRFEISSNRRTLPPTNFQDVFLSSGWRLSTHHSLFLDQYYTRDYLAYDLGPTLNHPDGLNTYQHMNEQFQGMRLVSLYGKYLVTTTLGRRSLSEEYRVSPVSGANNQGVHLRLIERSTIDLAGLQVNYSYGKTEFLTGTQLEYVTGRATDMHQQNWNFLPPDANSDNPYYYQHELNQLYGQYLAHVQERNAAGYFSITQRFGPLSLESGIRYEQFGNLDHSRSLLFRQRWTFRLSDNDRLSFYGGTFAENPVKRILEPYQVLVRANLAHLSSVHTKLISASYRHGDIKGEVFAKRVTSLPVLTPDYSRVSSEQGVMDGFIEIESAGQTDFYGADISTEWKQLLNSKFNLYLYYGYTHGVKRSSNVIVPFDLTARHKFQLDLGYRPTRTLRFGANIAGHTGYPYTPTFASALAKSGDRYANSSYTQYVASENSARFPLNMSLNLSAGMTIDRMEIFLNVVNATNRANPIINTADGFVYDAGLFPSIGIKMEF